MNVTLPHAYDFLPRFYRLAIVNILSNLMVPLAGTIGVAFLGHLSEINYLAGVALSTILFGYIYYGWTFLRMATTGLTAQAVGRDDREGMLLAGLRNGLIALALGVLILILQEPLQKLGFALLSGTPEVKAAGVAYFNARIWGAPAVLLNFVLIGWFLGREMSGKVLVLTVVGNAANILLDYLLIIRLDWASTGAGMATAISQYVTLLVGLILVSREISWKEIQSLAGKIWNVSAIRATFSLNGNLLLWSLAFTSTYLIFTNLSAAMGTITLAENALLLQLVFLSIYIFEGVGYATTTLSGNFKGKEANHQFFPLLQIAVGTSLLIGQLFAGMSLLFPDTFFGLLTNHTEVTEAIKVYVPWLVLVLGGVSIALVMEGYFAGLGEGDAVRNGTLIGCSFGFAPLAVCAWHFQSNHILWLALSAFMATRVMTLAVHWFRTHKSSTAVLEQIADLASGTEECSKVTDILSQRETNNVVLSVPD